METGGLLVILGVGVGAWFVRRWTKSGKAPDTSLKCLNCPKLVERIRQLVVLAIALGVLEVLTLFWLLGVWSRPR